MKEPLWDDPDPQTPGGRDLWDRLVNEGYTRANFDASEARDVGQRICRVEAEATAAAEQRLRSKVLALPAQPYTLSGLDTTTDSRMVNRVAVLALLDTPPPTSPRQGEPVDVERLRKALVATVRIDAYRDGPTAMRVTEPDDWQRIAEVIAAEYADLSEPAEAEQKETP